MKQLYQAVIAGLALVSLAAHAEGELNLYNWSDYVDPSTKEDFSKEYDIKINSSYYDSNETLEAKVLTGHSGYDLVVPSLAFIGDQIKAGAYQPIDKSKIPNYKNINPKFLKMIAEVDPNNTYAVPYFWGNDTLGINVDMVKKALGDTPMPDNVMDLIFKKEYADKLKSCGISMLDTAAEMFPAYLHYIGLNPNTNNPEDVKKAYEGIKLIAPDIKHYSSSGYIDELARGDLCMAFGYGGDLNIAKTRAEENKNGINIKVLMPKEGVALWFDSFAIPKDAKNVDNALRYINWTLDPKIAARNGDYVTYPPASEPAKALMDKKYADDPSIFPPEEIIDKSFVMLPKSPQIRRLYTRYWQRIKTSQ